VTLEQLNASIKTAALAARAIADAADGEKRQMTDAEYAEIGSKMEEIADLKRKKSLATADKTMRDKLKGLDGDISMSDFVDDDPENVAKKLAAAQAAVGGRRRKTIGEAFVGSDEYKTLIKSAPNGRFREKTRIESGAVQLKTLVTGGSDTSAGAFVINDNIGLQAGLDQFQRPLNVQGLFSQGQTTSDAVDYVQVTSTTNNASPVAESTTTATPGSVDAAHGVKSESGLALDKKTSLVRTFAHWIPATTRALTDAAQIRTLIDAFLTYGLREEVEDQIINGDGTGENFDGLLSVDGTQAYAPTIDTLGAVRHMRTLVRVVGRSLATAYLMHPYDWEAIDLLVDNTGRYYFGGPQQLGTPTIWGLPVVESESVAQGTIVCGDFRKGIVWDREDSTLAVSNSHADFFIRNMVAILAEDRYAFGIVQPNAFVIADMSGITE
jgi:HK97 family phage major capsid protein